MNDASKAAQALDPKPPKLLSEDAVHCASDVLPALQTPAPTQPIDSSLLGESPIAEAPDVLMQTARRGNHLSVLSGTACPADGVEQGLSTSNGGLATCSADRPATEDAACAMQVDAAHGQSPADPLPQSNDMLCTHARCMATALQGTVPAASPPEATVSLAAKAGLADPGSMEAALASATAANVHISAELRTHSLPDAGDAGIGQHATDHAEPHHAHGAQQACMQATVPDDACVHPSHAGHRPAEEKVSLGHGPEITATIADRPGDSAQAGHSPHAPQGQHGLLQTAAMDPSVSAWLRRPTEVEYNDKENQEPPTRLFTPRSPVHSVRSPRPSLRSPRLASRSHRLASRSPAHAPGSGSGICRLDSPARRSPAARKLTGLSPGPAGLSAGLPGPVTMQTALAPLPQQQQQQHREQQQRFNETNHLSRSVNADAVNKPMLAPVAEPAAEQHQQQQQPFPAAGHASEPEDTDPASRICSSSLAISAFEQQPVHLQASTSNHCPTRAAADGSCCHAPRHHASSVGPLDHPRSGRHEKASVLLAAGSHTAVQELPPDNAPEGSAQPHAQQISAAVSVTVEPADAPNGGPLMLQASLCVQSAGTQQVCFPACMLFEPNTTLLTAWECMVMARCAQDHGFKAHLPGSQFPQARCMASAWMPSSSFRCLAMLIRQERQ